jgi:hypothetical protein
MAKRKHTTILMSEPRFWKLIADARQAKKFHTALTAALKALSPDEIIGFQNTLRRKLLEAYKFPVLAANFIIQSYTSDDVFEDFRAWLVSQGQERFEAALSDPESICDWHERDEVDDMDGESMLFVAQKAYAEHGDEEDFSDRVQYPRTPDLKQEWPKDKAGFRKRWPRLVDKFWNQERIREIHGPKAEEKK